MRSETSECDSCEFGTMSDLEKVLEIRDLVDNTPLRNKLVDLKNWEKSMKQKEKELKMKNKVEVCFLWR